MKRKISELLLFVVHDHLMEGFAVFIDAIHVEGCGLAILGQNGFALICLAVGRGPDLFVGVIVDLLHEHGYVVSPNDRDRFSFFGFVVPGNMFPLGIDLIDRDRTIRVDGANRPPEEEAQGISTWQSSPSCAGKASCGHIRSFNRHRDCEQRES